MAEQKLKSNISPFSGNGLIGRRDFTITIFILGIVLFALDYALLMNMPPIFLFLLQNHLFVIIMLIYFISIAFHGFMIYLFMAAAVKRFRDLNLSEYSCLLLLVPAVNIFILIYLIFSKGKLYEQYTEEKKQKEILKKLMFTKKKRIEY